MTEHFLTDLFESYHRLLFWYCLRSTRRREDAEDLVQEVFYRVSRHAGRYRRLGRGQEIVWLLRIARNLIIDQQRKDSAPLAVDLPAPRAGHDTNLVLAFSLREALDRVGAADREVFILRETVGLTYGEIAELSGLTEDGVRARLFRVRGELRELLGGRVRSALRDDHKDNRP